MHNPIITSLLDTDAYKINMQQAVFHHYPDVHVTADFYCRSDEDLSYLCEQVVDHVHHLATLRFREDELSYLDSLGLYQADFLAFLSGFQFDPDQVTVGIEDGQLAIHIAGPWHEVILWEVPLLAIICELRNRACYPHHTVNDALKRLDDKLAHLPKDGFADGFQLVDFGTRRRFSREVHQAVVTRLHDVYPPLKGTSNVWLAKQLGLPPVGTQAHEWFQAHQQLAGQLADSQQLALQVWLQEYPDSLGIALTDCINMDAFLQDFDRSLCHAFSGLRHDSGNPIAWGEKAIAHYREHGIDPKDKTLVFSDSLTLAKAVHIYQYFADKATTSFGIGTQLTCDLPNVKTLNVVIKLTTCQGKPVAKISDEPNKAICKDEAHLSALKAAFKLPD
ncbi:nicotinate phosphoribosyltransferase [Salinivibrio kushneri]|uniref:Nicotinate phosphoribosyltransferase n=1 Tax=Salinivibrio kushneri TaxID=1908198 RepID=A0AB36K4T3_9GAMM|nr:nicotinate phosphoribosyltransferase [Salinivibrio kushneri]OOE43500.1 nicotinate phosphoribosyltransferase [Salinivibrio kushneri]OOE45472.1 nicotinate phosphoribosyltransferase [Salinivibrio kushneri]